MAEGTVVVVGGTSGLGKEVARHYADRDREVVLSGRDAARAEAVAGELGGKATGIALDLNRPTEIAASLADVGTVAHLVIAAIERDENRVLDYDIEGAIKLTTLKLVGYSAVVHALARRLADDASIVLFGGLAKDRPYPGSTTVSTVNGGITGMVTTLATELAPVRVNAIHPGIVGDSPYWAAKPPEVLEAVLKRVPTGRLVSMDDIVDATVFLLENRSVNAVDLRVDGGTLLL
jgi:NAD(P)-dependent dehydrogenase (short-subunit alcohol dehydrogenase family)